MDSDEIHKINVPPIKQLLNFVEKECSEYDISQYWNSILLLNGNDQNRLLKVKLFIQLDNKKETLKFFDHTKFKSGIKKKMIIILNSIFTSKRDNHLYEIELRDLIGGKTISVGAMKFHSQNNVRIICREYNGGNEISIVIIEQCPKKGQKNKDDGNYNNRLKAALNLNHYYIDKLTNKKIYL